MTETRSIRAASLLLEARRTRQWVASLPEECRPKDLADAYSVQNLVLAELGEVAAWKVGAGSPEGLPACAAIARATLFETGARLPPELFNLVGVEAEIAYRFSNDLPPREEAYTEGEVAAAIETIHAAIEISDTRFLSWASQDRLSHIADQLNHGTLVIGPGVRNWRELDPIRQRVLLTINGVLSSDMIGGNPAGDPMRLLEWLANDGSRMLGGIRAGHVVTTGSMTGVVFKSLPVDVRADLVGYESVRVMIG